MNIYTRFSQRHSNSIVAAMIMALLFVAIPALAGIMRGAAGAGQSGVGILIARAEPGYSLEDLARVTAAFNVTDRSGPAPTLVDGSAGSKFQMLFTTGTNTSNAFHADQSTYFYVPVFQTTSSPAVVVGVFPNLANREAVLSYVFSHTQLGLQESVVTIDGQAFPLDERYVVAVTVDPLPDGGGTGYLTSAAVLKPLKTGQHTIEISAKFTGDALAPDGFAFTNKYTVNVK